MVNILLKKALGIVRSRGWSLLKAFGIFFIMSYLQDDGNYAEGRPEHRNVNVAKQVYKGCVPMHTTSKRIELESPGCSDFEKIKTDLNSEFPRDSFKLGLYIPNYLFLFHPFLSQRPICKRKI